MTGPWAQEGLPKGHPEKKSLRKRETQGLNRYPGPWKCVPYDESRWEIVGDKDVHICFVDNTSEGREKGHLIAFLRGKKSN